MAGKENPGSRLPAMSFATEEGEHIWGKRSELAAAVLMLRCLLIF